MATAEQRQALFSVPCPHCGAGPRVECFVAEPETNGRYRRHPLRVTTLDAGCHDARWRLAVNTDAPVLAEAVAAKIRAAGQRVTVASEVDAGTVAVMERPW